MSWTVAREGRGPHNTQVCILLCLSLAPISVKISNLRAELGLLWGRKIGTSFETEDEDLEISYKYKIWRILFLFDFILTNPIKDNSCPVNCHQLSVAQITRPLLSKQPYWLFTESTKALRYSCNKKFYWNYSKMWWENL